MGLASYYRKFINQFAENPWCLYELVGQASNKNKKKSWAKKNTTTVIEPEPRIFKWMMKHWDSFHALKEALSTAPVLGYHDFSRELMLETDASLNGLDTILSQQGKDWKIHVITCTSHSLYPSERLMCNYFKQSWSWWCWNGLQ